MEKNITKECKVHGVGKHTLREGSRYRCSACSVDAVDKRRHKLKQMAVEYKGGKCFKCGYNKCIQALEFHHLDPNNKDFSISKDGNTRGWDKIKVEIDKCVLVCANCHRELHAAEYS